MTGYLIGGLIAFAAVAAVSLRWAWLLSRKLAAAHHEIQEWRQSLRLATQGCNDLRRIHDDAERASSVMIAELTAQVASLNRQHEKDQQMLRHLEAELERAAADHAAIVAE